MQKGYFPYSMLGISIKLAAKIYCNLFLWYRLSLAALLNEKLFARSDFKGFAMNEHIQVLFKKNILLQCLDHEFGCENGECIPLEFRCDGHAECENNFDEKNCTMVVTHEDLYSNGYPPQGKDGEKLPILISLTNLSFGRIDELNEHFNLRSILNLKW